MSSFTDNFLSRIELAFSTRLNLPRDVAEAKRLYEFILTLPASDKGFLFKRNTKYGSPYIAQMFFCSVNNERF